MAPQQPQNTSIQQVQFGYKNGDLRLTTHSYSGKPTPYWNHDLLHPGSKAKFGRFISEKTDQKHLKQYGTKYGRKYGKQGATYLFNMLCK